MNKILVLLILLVLVLLIIRREVFTSQNTLNYVIDVVKTSKKKQDKYFYYFSYLVKFFDEYDIKYYITYGTLLGVVRHKGQFIPWDDDIDIAMNNFNFNKFINICEYLGDKETRLENNYKSLNKQVIKNNRNIICRCHDFIFGTNGFITIVKHQLDFYQIYIRSNQASIKVLDIFLEDTQHKFGINNKVTNFLQYKDLIYPLKKVRFREIYVYSVNKQKLFLYILFGKGWKEYIVWNHNTKKTVKISNKEFQILESLTMEPSHPFQP